MRLPLWTGIAVLCLAGCAAGPYRGDGYGYGGQPGYGGGGYGYNAPPPAYYQPPPAPEGPRLSDNQKRAFQNCVMLPTHMDRERCRATVMSTVR